LSDHGGGGLPAFQRHGKKDNEGYSAHLIDPLYFRPLHAGRNISMSNTRQSELRARNCLEKRRKIF
jgi:hypothetical protein